MILPQAACVIKVKQIESFDLLTNFNAKLLKAKFYLQTPMLKNVSLLIQCAATHFVLPKLK